ncbi:hypothetical protein HJG53_03100 [Sphingomonas sp. ID1715]|uniref:beta strand repeat-containing protein n=1 Tax=Sphingomonas sp. ID1715 TaxID=1656898 RepID=UPI0014880A4A|nr:hypothetical protein [Sphingomonas sp. ID1715]NNM75894.1 hypothetical protein [Sphingomonas sp. ID1715]
MPAYPTPLRRRARLLAGCAIALGLSVQAQAQNAFQATFDGTGFGSANVTRGQTVDGKLTDIVTINSKQAVINWTATGSPILDGSVKVLDTNNQLLFTADGNSVGSYTVLNRIGVSAPGTPAIRIDGIVKSQLDFGYGATQPGGSILFYSPGGIIAGATSQFDVGSLVLSAADVDYDSGYGIFRTDPNAQTGTIQFRANPDSRAFVTVENGASLKANDNYVALVAPRVTQAGTVSAAGSIAYVAAESADITIPVSGGLFDISIGTGSAVDVGGETTLTHSGTTTGPVDNGTIADRRIYMVAVPKNDAVTMLVSGTIGYTPAASVQLADGGIVLAAANNINGDAVSGLATGSSVQLAGGSLSSNLKGYADRIALSTSVSSVTSTGSIELHSDNGAISLAATGGRSVTVAGLTSLLLDDGRQGATINVSADAGSTIGLANLVVSSQNTSFSGSTVTGADIGLNAAGGIITASDIILSTQALGSSGNAGVGGGITIAASGSGKIQTGSLTAVTIGQAADSGYGAGAGTGGAITTSATGGGLIDAGSITFRAKGLGGNGSPGGNATGGTIAVNATGGTITSGGMILDASAVGGNSFGSGRAGSATGGTVTVTSGAGGQITGGGTLLATGTGGNGSFSGRAGDGTGGAVTLQSTGGAIDLADGTTFLIAQGIGGNNQSSGTPSTGRGGTVQVSIGGGTGLLNFGVLNLVANGGFDAVRDRSPVTTEGGTGVGGTATFEVSGGLAQGDTLFVTADGQGAGRENGGTGGSGYQGRAAVSLTGGVADFGLLRVRAEALGGNGNNQDSGYGVAAGSGGTAGIGTSPYQGTLPAGAIVTVTGGALQADSVQVSADSSGGIGGDGDDFASTPLTGTGGAATGGVASFVSSGAASLSLGGLYVHANANAQPPAEEERTRGGQGGSIRTFGGFGADAVAGAGGTSIGGSATISIGGSEGLDVGAIYAEANGFGGLAGEIVDADNEGVIGLGAGGRGGDGSGGIAGITLNTGIGPSSVAFASADGTGADGGTGPAGGSGGNGLGGNASVTIVTGTSSFGGLYVSSNGTGGAGADGKVGTGGAGGFGKGASAALTIGNGAIITAQGLRLQADGVGRRGGDGSVSAVGLDGGAGGAGEGGTVSLSLASGSLTLFGGEGISTAFLSANADGGQGGLGGDAQEGGGGAGGNGGDATAGTISILSTNGSLEFPASEISADASAGTAGSGGLGAENGLNGVEGTALAGTISIDAQHDGSGTAQLDFGFSSLSADAFANDGFGGRAGHVFVNAAGGSSDGAIRFTTLDVSANGDEGAVDALPGIRLSGSGLTRSTGRVSLGAVGDVVLTGRLDVGGSLDIASNADLKLLTGADVGVQQNISLQSGDDIIIGSGALLRGTSGEIPESGYGGPQLDIFAGGVSRRGGIIVEDISSFILEGNIDASDRTVTVHADAVVGRIDTQFSAGNLYVLLNNLPEGNEFVPSDDLGQLRPLRSPACLQGDVCLGNVAVSGVLEIGNAFFGIPINVRLNGGVDAERVTLLGRNVRLGQANQTNFIKASDSLTIASLSSSLFLDGDLTVTGGTGQNFVGSALNINGTNATLGATGRLDIYALNNVGLKSIDAASVRTVNFEGTVIESNGIKVAGLISIGTATVDGDLTLAAGKGVTLAQANLSGGSLTMTADIGAVTLGGGTVGSAVLRGDTVSASLNATGAVTIEARTGDGTLGSISAGQLDASIAGDAVFTSLQAVGDITIDAGGALTGGSAAGGSVFLTGASLNADSLVGSSGNVEVNVDGDLGITTASAAGSLFLTGGGTTSFGTLSGSTIAVSGSQLVTGGSATGSFIQLVSDGDVTVSGTLDAVAPESGYGGGAIDIFANGDVDLGAGAQLLADEDITVRAGDDVRIGNGATLLAGRNAPGGSASPLSGPGQLRIEAGAINVFANEPVGAGNVHAIVIGDGATLTGRTVTLTGEAIQAATASVVTAANLFVRINAASPLADAPLDDGGALLAECVRGNVCLGRLAVSGQLRIGEDDYVANRVSLAGQITGNDVLIRSRDTLTLGDDLAAAAIELGSLSGDLVLSDGATVQSTGTLRLAAGRDIAGAGATVSGSAVDLAIGRNMSLGALNAATLRTIDAAGAIVEASGLVAPGAITIGTLAVSASGAPSGVKLSAGTGAVSIADVQVSSGVTATGTAVSLAGSNGLFVQQAAATAGDVALSTGAGTLRVNDATATGAITADSAADLTFVRMNAGGALTLTAAGDIAGAGQLRGSTITVQTPGKLDMILAGTSTSGAISIAAAKGIHALGFTSAGTMTLAAADGAIVLSSLAGGTDIVATAKSILLNNDSGLDVKQAIATSGDVTLGALGGAITADAVSATGNIFLAASTGTSFGNLAAGSAVTVDSGGNVGGGTASGASLILAAGGTFAADTLKATGGNIQVSASKGLTLASLNTPGTATLKAGTGALAVADANAASFAVSGGSVALASTGNLVVTQGSASAGDLTLASAGGDISLAQASASGTLKASSAGAITVTGAAAGSKIAFVSKDLTIGETAQLGSKTLTTDISLTSTADRLFLGDAAGTGYRIDSGELTRIVSGGDISIASAPQNVVGDAFELLDPGGTNIVSGSLVFDGSQLGQNGTLKISTSRAIGFTGNVQYKNFVNTQQVTYSAGSDISLAAETGLVTIKNSSGGLAGTLELSAQQVHAMSTKARSEIPGLQLNEVRQRLGTNDQLENNGGYFQANRIIVNIGRLAFIQNSGANGNDPNLKRGISANELIFRSTGTQPAQLIINGQEGTVTGEAFGSAIALNGTFDPQSAFNGCVSGVSCAPVIVDPGPNLELPAEILLSSSRDQVQDEEDEDEKEEALQAAQTRPDPVIQMAPAPTSRFDPLIDEPVTGAGNEDLWEPTTPIGPTP